MSSGLSSGLEVCASRTSGTTELGSGTTELSGGTTELGCGTTEFADGATELRGGTSELADGATELADGATELGGGSPGCTGGARGRAGPQKSHLWLSAARGASGAHWKFGALPVIAGPSRAIPGMRVRSPPASMEVPNRIVCTRPPVAVRATKCSPAACANAR